MPDAPSNGAFSARARWLYPLDGPPVENGVLNVRSGRIVSLGNVTPEFPLQDWGEVGITPGWINAHTHLEFSSLSSPLGEAAQFSDWIRDVISWRLARDEDPVAGAEAKRGAIESGLQESLRGGATRLGEIATAPWPETPFQSSSLRGTMFLELLGLSEEHHDRLLKLADDHVVSSQSGWAEGISPHAPYTVGLSFLEQLCQRRAQTSGLVAMHLAETFEELELLASSSGPLRELLDQLGAWDASALPRGVSVMDYLQALAQANRALIVHGNYLMSEEIEFLGLHEGHMSVVYCPRTHAHFQHGAYPLEELWKAGVNVAVGTDSRASNPDLRMLQELKFLVDRCGIPPERVLEMATRCGARALGVESTCGSLAPQRDADLTVVALASEPASDPHERLFADGAEVAMVYIAGKLAYRS